MCRSRKHITYSQVVKSFLCFWKLHPQKLLVKCWWNWHQIVHPYPDFFDLKSYFHPHSIFTIYMTMLEIMNRPKVKTNKIYFLHIFDMVTQLKLFWCNNNLLTEFRMPNCFRRKNHLRLSKKYKQWQF